MRQRIFHSIHNHPLRAAVVVVTGILFLLLSKKHLYPTLSTTRVRQGQTLDYFLHATFGGNHNFAYAALYHIRNTAPTSFNPDYLQANYGFQKNGYVISIKRGNLTIVGPNDQAVVSSLPILSQRTISLYFRQAIFHNILLMLSCCTVAFVVIQAPAEGILRLGKKIVLTLVIIPVLVPILVLTIFLILLTVLSFINSFFR